MSKDTAFREATRILEAAWTSESPRISLPRDAFLVPAVHRYAIKHTEYFLVLTLDGAHNVIKLHVASQGLVNRTLIHPREVFRPCLSDNAVACILLHNHPSGNLEPSPDDREITKRLIDASEIIGISVLDHLVISKRGYYSFLEHGLIEPPIPS